MQKLEAAARFALAQQIAKGQNKIVNVVGPVGLEPTTRRL